MVEIGRTDRVRIEVEAPEVRHPREPGRVLHHDLVRRPPGRERQLNGVEPGRPILRGALLEEEVPRGAVHEPLEGHRPTSGAGQRPVGHGQVVPDKVHLGMTGHGEVELVGIGDRHLPIADAEHFLGRRHRDTIAR